MAKPDPALLDPARFPFRTEVDVRFGDIDVNRHVNNVAISGFVEEGRVRFHRASGYHAALAGLGSMAVSVAIEFVGQAYYPGTLAICAGASRLGTTSYELELLLLQDDRPVAHARSTMVCTKDGQPSAIPDAFRESVKPWMVR
jgi:acyl-CoA thioester hydrolase